MNDVEKLLAIEEIKQLRAKYFRFGDTKQLDEMKKLFAEDCVVDLSGSVTDPETGVDIFPEVGSQVLKGPDEIMTAYGAGTGVTSVHHGYNSEIEITGDNSAKGVWAMTDRLFFSDAYPVKALTGYGHYHETYLRVDGVWKFHSIRLTRIRVEVVNR
jgi:hypothetical protein